MYDRLPTTEDFGEWEHVLPGNSYYSGTYSVLDGAQVDDVTADRIARVDAFHVDSPEGYGSTDMCCLVELTDGTWAACMAWCDTTGWDCQSNVEWKWAPTRELAISQGLDRDARRNLGVPLPGEDDAAGDR